MKLSKRTRKDIYGQLLISAGLALLAVILTQDIFFSVGPLKDLQLKFLDERFNKRGEVSIEDTSSIILVEITQDSFDQIPPPYNAFPWPRNLYARLIDNLTEAGVKAIGIDIVMSNEDRLSPVNDSLLARAIRNSGRVVMAGKIDERREALAEKEASGDNLERGALVRKSSENFGNRFFAVDSGMGIVNVVNDKDGVFRRYTPFVYSVLAGKRIPTFSYAVLNKYLGLRNLETVSVMPGFFRLKDIDIPRYDVSSRLVNFYGIDRQYTWKRFNFIDIIDDNEFTTLDEQDFGVNLDTWDNPDYGLLQSGIFKDKIVLIGSTMPEDNDIIPIALSRGIRKGDNLIYGVEFHATELQNILEKNFLVKQSSFSEIVMIIILTLGVFWFSSSIKRIRIYKGIIVEAANLVIVAGIIAAIYYFSIFFFIEYKIVTAIISPIVAVTFGYVGSTTYNFISIRKQSGEIKRMFSHYVSGELVNELIDDPEKLKLGGESRKVTIFFSDIAGFSSFSEKLTADDLVSVMNEYLTEMTDIVIKNYGTLDKYVGDAIMAFWGAPVPLEDHEFHACSAALEMRRRLKLLREDLHERNLPDIDIRIGINTGDVVVGNIGSATRFNYTVMGDAVNLASRLEGANKQYGTKIMISEETRQKVKERFFTRQLDTIRVKGRSAPTRVFELIGRTDDPETVKMKEHLKNYNDAIKLYKDKNFQEALELFKLCKESCGDSASKVYIERCKFYIDTPPSENWDGVFTMKTK